MANTRTATKRARQSIKRQERNQTIKSATRTALRTALDAIKTKDLAKVKEAYHHAVKAISKAASKGSIPKSRASRKISRLTRLTKKALPTVI